MTKERWHCVMQIRDAKIVYLGTIQTMAQVNHVDGTHWAEAATSGECVKRADTAVGLIRRGISLPSVEE